jgi:hypothetical protein
MTSYGKGITIVDWFIFRISELDKKFDNDTIVGVSSCKGGLGALLNVVLTILTKEIELFRLHIIKKYNRLFPY